MKEKIKTKILPIWLSCLILVSAIQPAVFLFSHKNRGNASLPSQAPQVLGESTQIRGDEAPVAQPISQIKDPNTSLVSAKSFIVFDLSTGRDLLQKNPGQKLSIASLTKLLTAYVAYQNIDLNQDMSIGRKDILGVKPNLNFLVGDKVKALDVFNAMLVGSCNDAALALGNYTSEVTGQTFIGLMNIQAKSLGMESSSFSNPMGFDSANNYSTVHDIKALISATENLAVFKNLGRRTTYEFSGSLGKAYSTVATNKLLKDYPDLEAIKTGFTQGAGGAMATKLTTAGHEIVILVLDSQNREADTLKLRETILNDFKWN